MKISNWIYSILLLTLLLISTTSFARTSKPFVFVHGLGVPTAIYQKPFDLEKVFKEKGHEVIVIKSPMISTIKNARDYAIKDLAKRLPDGEFHLIGHSQGGLVVRLLAHDPQLQSRILSITTMDSPHQGSVLADDMAAIYDKSGGKLPGWAKSVLDKIFGGNIEVLKEITTQNIQNNFNINITDMGQIPYYSMGHYLPAPEWDYTAIDILAGISVYLKKRGETMNDGLVNTPGMKWGQHLGDFPGDHWAETYPVPFGKNYIYKETFFRAIDNIDQHFNL